MIDKKVTIELQALEDLMEVARMGCEKLEGEINSVPNDGFVSTRNRRLHLSSKLNRAIRAIFIAERKILFE